MRFTLGDSVASRPTVGPGDDLEAPVMRARRTVAVALGTVLLTALTWSGAQALPYADPHATVINPFTRTNGTVINPFTQSHGAVINPFTQPHGDVINPYTDPH